MKLSPMPWHLATVKDYLIRPQIYSAEEGYSNKRDTLTNKDDRQLSGIYLYYENKNIPDHIMY